jgi:adenine-specific DNA-methyltransferase
VAEPQTSIRTMRGVQQSFLMPPPVPILAPLEPKGVVYTKRWVVELLLDLAGYVSSANLIDSVAVEPSAGDGAFLSLMVERLLDSCERFARPICDCEHSIVAFELNDVSAIKARLAVTNVLVNRGIELSTARLLAGTWVRTGDYLMDSMTIEADFVIGNPPYVRLEEIPEETALLYRQVYPTMYGRADMYVAFFEAALRQLRESGTCAFICADRWMRNQYGSELREFITAGFAVDVIIEMHNADAFHDEVDAYPAISVIRRQGQGPVIVASAGPEVEDIPTSQVSSLLFESLRSNCLSLPKGLKAARIDRWFKGCDPWPCQSPEQLSLLRRLEEEFSPLERNAKVGIGVATGNDRVFITKDAHLVEPSRLLKLAMAKDIGSGKMNWSGHFLVDPWNGEGLVRLEKYPRLSSYFTAHGAALKKRHTAIKSMHAWYKTIDRVTHTLTEKPKLYIADIRNTLEPVLDRGDTYPHHNLYFIQSEDWDLEVLGGLLISAIGQFFVESYCIRMRGGYLRFQAQYLRRIRVPAPTAISTENANELRQAFRERDKERATKIALEVYGIEHQELERALGH